MKKIDERGHACPLPVINAKNALAGMKEGEELTVIVDNEIAVQNLSKLAAQKGHGFSSEKKADKEYVVKLVASAASGNVTGEGIGAKSADSDAAEEEVYCDCTAGGSNVVVMIGSSLMGNGDEALGKILMKGFIFSLTQLEQLPSSVIFYNSGAYITCEGSESIEDLKKLEEAGVEIYTCGTCLNHYGIAKKLQVGTATNMYAISEMAMNAGHVVKP